ncbi:MAG: ParB/RepB/Spo0J family partition protein [Gemmatimonadales bacterium]
MSERRLGRGLEALLGPMTRDEAESAGLLREVPVDQLRPNPYQPRREFDETALTELASSISTSGLLQPIVVREHDHGYQIIAGERRWRAIQGLGWSTVSAIVRAADDQMLLTMALVENLQRDDLNPIDEALGYDRLMTEFAVSATDVARLVGRDRSTVANTLRLLKLPVKVQHLVQRGALSAGHGRALLGLSGPGAMKTMAQRAVDHGWSVRDIESQVSRGTRPRRRAGGKSGGPQAATVEARRIEEALRSHLGTDVRLTAKRRGRGLLTISYYSNDDLARILELMLGEPYQG